MTRLYNDPSAFASEMTAGLVAAAGRWLERVPGGVIRSTVPAEPRVAVVIGGGSGHYPAFAGIVGQGLADGAAMGNVFASPSAQQVHDVASRVQMGRGVLLTYGNYAGDVLNFDAAQDRLRAEGIACRTVTVTDDLSSAPPEEAFRRRGVAGDLVVFKCAAAAAATGADLDAVAEVAARANARTRSFGVAFSGCTLPGAAGPLFTVPAGRMGVGMGIHGEPGLREGDVPSAHGLAELLVSSLLAEVPPESAAAGDTRVVAILNGLGAVKYEELFVVYASVARLLEAAGLTIVEPEVGELVTSLDMAGVSLTLAWLDDELEGYWRAPADTPAYRKGTVAPDAPRATMPATAAAATPADASLPPASPASASAAGGARRAFVAIRDTLVAREDDLGRIDAVAGDGDHGIGMVRGSTAALAALEVAVPLGAGLGTALRRAGDAWETEAGGTSGALWGAALRAAGTVLGDEAAPDAVTVHRAVSAALEAITSRGGAVVGDKTMVDAMAPFAETLAARVDAGDGLAAAWAGAVVAAEAGAASTAGLVARLGRARPHGERSLGTFDAGAVSFAAIVRAVASGFGG